MNRRKLDVPRLLKALGISATLRGREWWALCPSPHHNDRKASWRMKDAPLGSKHGSMHCFPCGLKGGPADLVMAVRGIGLPAALAWLDDLHKGEQAEEPVDAFRWDTYLRRDRSFRLPPEGVFDRPLDEWVSGAREYLLSRGVTEDQAERYGLGYAVDGRLAGRIIFPARDVDGRARNYTARDFGCAPPSPGDAEAKKYLAASGAERPDVGMMMGEQFWPPPAERVVVVVLEGAINGLAVERASGLPFGTLDGNNPRPAHFMKLASFPRVVLLTDPDRAGELARESLACGLVRHAVLDHVKLPPRQDAQSLGDDLLARYLDPYSGIGA